MSGDPGESYFRPTLAQDRVSGVRANSFSAPPIVIGELREGEGGKLNLSRSAQSKLHANRAQRTKVNSHGSALGPHLSEDHHETSRLQPSGNWSRLSTSGCSQGLAFLGSRRNRSVAGWFYDVREERRPGIDPQKSVTGFRFGGRGRGRPDNIVKKPAKFSRFFRCLQIFQIFWSIVASFFFQFHNNSKN